MLSVISWKWKPKDDYRSKFTAEHVNIHKSMVKKNLTIPHRYICITDDPIGLDPDIEVIPLWDDYADVPNPMEGKRPDLSWPSCYRRLKVFERNASSWLGDRILSLDLDIVITGNIDHIASRTEDFVIWLEGKTKHINGSIWMLKTDSHPEVWEDFDPIESPKLTKNIKIKGSDQAWFKYKLESTMAAFTGENDRIYGYSSELGGKVNKTVSLPKDAAIISFNGRFNPWCSKTQIKAPWIKEYWRL